MEGPSVLS